MNLFYLLTQTARAEMTHAAQGQPAGDSHAAHPEVLNWVQLIARLFEPSPFSDFLLRWEKAICSSLVIALITVFVLSVSRRRRRVPSRAQALLEEVVTALDGFVCGVLGPRGRAYTPFLGSLFIYILVSNLFGLIPLQNATMAFVTTTAPIALCVFFYVQWIGIKENGLGGYFYHLAGSPKNAFGWVLVVIMLPLHVLGELIRPLTLSARLFGNMLSGHILLAVFLMLGIQVLRPLRVPAGLPLHVPFLLFELMVGAIQAFVFTLLSTVYIAMMLPHEHESEGHGAAGAAHG